MILGTKYVRNNSLFASDWLFLKVDFTVFILLKLLKIFLFSSFSFVSFSINSLIGFINKVPIPEEFWIPINLLFFIFIIGFPINFSLLFSHSYSKLYPFSLIFFILHIKHSIFFPPLLINNPTVPIFLIISSVSSISKNESTFKLSSSFTSIIDILYLSSFINVFLFSFVFNTYTLLSKLNSIFFCVSSSFFPIKSVVVINTGKVDFLSGKDILQRNPEPFLPSFSIVIIDFSKFEFLSGFENSSNTIF